MRIVLNLATRPFVDEGPALKSLRIAMAVLALAAVGLLWGLHAFHRKAEDARARERAVDGQIATIEQERGQFQSVMHQPVNAETMAHVKALNALFDEKAFSWTLAMEDLETVLPGGVQVSTLEPIRAKDGTITLHLRVLGPRDRAVELVQNLEHSRRFLMPRIVGESAESQGGPGEALQPISASNRVNFDVLADYNTAANAEPAATPARAKVETPAAKPAAGGTRRPAPASIAAGPKPSASHVRTGGPQ